MNLFDEVRKYLEARERLQSTEEYLALKELEAIVLGRGGDLLRCHFCPAWMRKQDLLLTEYRPASIIRNCDGSEKITPRRRLDRFRCPSCGTKQTLISPDFEEGD